MDAAQALIARGCPAEAAAMLAAELERIDAAGAQAGLTRRAEAGRMLGTALRDAGDLQGSSAALQAAIDSLERAAARTSHQDVVLALTLRSMALNAARAGDTAGARAGRVRALDLALDVLAAEPVYAVGIGMAITEEEMAEGVAPPLSPIDRLRARAEALPAAPAVAALVALHVRLRGAGDERAQQVLQAAFERLQALDDDALRAVLPDAENVAAAALNAGAPDMAHEVAARVAALPGEPKADASYAWRRIALACDGAVQPLPAATCIERTRELVALARTEFGDEDARLRVALREAGQALSADGRRGEAITAWRETYDLEIAHGSARDAASVAYGLGTSSTARAATTRPRSGT